jgi:hypothetical protein
MTGAGRTAVAVHHVVRALIAATLVIATAPATLVAQSAAADAAGLATLIENVFGPRGLTVNSEAALPDGSTHSAHFNSAFQSNFGRFNIALASQLSSLPLPSPASGFTYGFDATTGTFIRSTQSFGPILADRAETIGRGKVLFGYSLQFFSFDSLDGVDLRHVPAVFTHDDHQLGGGRADIVVTTNALEASVTQFTGLVTYGLGDRMDLSAAVPLLHTRLAVASNAVIHRFGTTGPSGVHFFTEPTAPDGIGDHKQFAASGSATGIGDIVLRAKGTLLREGQRAFAAGLEVRLPSGDEDDLLGSGAWGVKPFAVLSFTYKRLSPHVNLGYQWNGASVLAGSVTRREKASMPDRLTFAAGFDAGLNERLTLAVDVFADRVLDSPQLSLTSFRAEGPLGSGVFSDIAFTTKSYMVRHGSVGMKTRVGEAFLANFNVRFKAGGRGLSDHVTPMLGFEYTF